MRARVCRLAESAGYVPNSKLGAMMNEVRLSGSPEHRGTLGLLSLYREEQPWLTWPHLGEIVRGATRQANAHGYRLDPFWLLRAGMTPRRMRTILQTRRVEGVFCLGAEKPGTRFPAELDCLPICTQGVSIVDNISRTTSHHANDARGLLFELYRRGYNRPALTIEIEGDRRTDFAYSNTYSGLAGRLFADGVQPILRCSKFDETEFEAWLRICRPDALIIHQAPAFTVKVQEHLARRSLRVPEDIGIALLDMTPDPARYTGIRQNFELIGASAIDLLLTKVLLPRAVHHDHPIIEAIPAKWNEGTTLRPPQKPARKAPDWMI